MPVKPTTKGYIYAIVATIALSNVYIFSKAALNLTSLPQFGFYWFGFAVLWNLLFSIISGKFNTIKPLSTFQIKHLIGIGITEIVATTSIFIAIFLIPNPAIPSLLRNLEPVLIVVLAIIILKERFNSIELFGVILTLFGTILISLNKINDINHLFINGVQYVVISSVFYAIRTIWSKKVIHHFTAHALNLNKVGALFLTSVIALLIYKDAIMINPLAFWHILIGSFIGPFLTSLTQFLSLKYIDASRSNLVLSSTGFITILLAWWYFGILPYLYQIIGGVIIFIGLFLLIWKRSKTAHN